MSEYCFNVETSYNKPPMTQKEHTRRDKIAEKIGGKRCGHTMILEPTGQWKAWFYIPNRGNPFDRDLAKEILDNL